MTFKKTKESGERDPRIARIGRSRKDDTRSKREIKDEEMLRLARKFKSYLTDAVQVSAKILNMEEAKPMERLQAAKLILNEYVKAIDAVYGDADDETLGEELQEKNNAPVFSLTVIKPEDNN